MPEVTKEVRAQFTADTGSYRSSMKAVSEDTKAARQESDRMAEAVRRAGDVLRQLPQKAKGVFSTLRSGLSTGVQFLRGFGEGVAETAMERLRQRAGDTGSTLAQVSRQIRNIHLTSLALRGAGLIFGELRGMVQQYISSNTAAQSAVNALKSAFSNALAPAVNIVINAFSAALPVVQAVSNAFATLVTNLFGAKWTTITGGAAAAATAIGGTGKAAQSAAAAQKALNRELYSFDQITRAGDNNSGTSGGSGSSGGSGGGTGTETITGGSGVLGLFSQFSDLFEPFRAAWENKGAQVVNAALTAFERLKTAAADVKDSFVTVWTEGTGQNYVESQMGKWTALLNIISALAGSFDQAWTQAGRGEGVIRSIFERATAVNNLISAIGNSFAKVWSNGTGTAIWGSLLDIVTNVNNTVRNLADNTTTAWNKAGTGEGIWQAVLNPVKSVLTVISNLTAKTADWAANLNVGPMLTAVRNLLTAIDPFVKGIGSALEGIWSVMLAVGQWALEGPIPDFLNGTATALSKLGEFVQNLGESVKVLGDWASQVKFNGIEGLMNGDGLFSVPDVKELTVNLKSVWASSSDEQRMDFYQQTKNKTATGTLKAAWTTSGENRARYYKNYLVNKNVSATLKGNWGSKAWDRFSYYNDKIKTKTVTGTVNAKAGSKIEVREIIKPGGINFSSGGRSVGSVRAVPYAKGGIVNAATLFGGNSLVGEAGREAIVPLENNTEWLDKLAERLHSQPSVIEIHIGSEKLVRYVIDGVNTLTAQTGRCPIYV